MSEANIDTRAGHLCLAQLSMDNLCIAALQFSGRAFLRAAPPPETSYSTLLSGFSPIIGVRPESLS